MDTREAQRADRLELILQQLDALPTLPAVATRLLQVTSADDSDAQQVIELVASDQALTAKVLSLCRTAEKGLNESVTTVGRAVLMLGFEAIRNAVLSIKVLEVFADETGNGEAHTASGFSVAAFWRHSLAVAVAAELIAAAHPRLKNIPPGEAFVCGLLHDVGKLAIEHLLPKSYQRVIELTEQHQVNIADVERRVIGLDHMTVGKHLAEHWQMPDMIRDAIWLHGSPAQALPDLPHRRMIELVALADLLVRRQHIGYSGNHAIGEDLARRATDAGFDPKKVEGVVDRLREELERRAAAMGLGQTPSRKLFLESIMQANAVLGRLNTELATHRRTAAGQSKVLDAIVHFHARSAGPTRSVQTALTSVVASAVGSFGEGFYAVLFQPAPAQPWLFNTYSRAGRLVGSEFVQPPVGSGSLAELCRQQPVMMHMNVALAWIAPQVPDHVEPANVSVLSLPCGWGAAAVLLHDRPRLADTENEAHCEALRQTWGAAIAAAAEHQSARRLAEQLADTNRQLVEAQQTVLRTQSMAQLGEMAAGAAHEMNNPLAVISGRAQLLIQRLPMGSRERQDADVVWHQAERLSDLITSMRLFAHPPEPKLATVNLADVLEDAVGRMKRRAPAVPAIRVSGLETAPLLFTDREQLAALLSELLVNAAESKPAQSVRVQASVDTLNDRLILLVKDDGCGMDAATLEHAFDPFFSAKPAGRQVGLGLSRARRMIELLGGTIELTSVVGVGTTARIAIPIRSPHDAAMSESQTPQRAEGTARGGTVREVNAAAIDE
ncbi:MAG: HDOD domain-containing protein [Planctomycetes bacterium]|nr:HDOD domain-containing protein [Planctomycetota bacterium]